MKKYLPVLLIFCAFGCQPTNNSFDNNPTMSNQSFTNQDTKIEYDICGAGDVTVLLIHGWCIDRSFWDKQREVLCEQYQVVTLDLPGHGNSGKNRSSWSIEEYGQDVASLIDKLNLNNVVLVGHSMGGDIMLEAALLQKNKVVGLVGIDNFKGAGIPADSVTQAQITGFMNYLRADFQGAIDVFSSQYLFSNQTDSTSKLKILKSLHAADTIMAVEALQSVFDYAHQEIPALSALNIKLYLINSDVTPTVVTHLKEQSISFEVIDIAGTGHYPMIEKPLVFNRLLLSTLKQISSSSSY